MRIVEVVRFILFNYTSMKVKELLEKLQKADKEAEVVFDTEYWLHSVFDISETIAKSEDGDIKFCILEYWPHNEEE